jgi:hypothetical protein
MRKQEQPEDNIIWYVGDSLHKARIGTRVVPKSVWKHIVPDMKPTDRLVFFPLQPFTSMSVSLRGNTIEDVFHTINDNLHYPIYKPNDHMRQQLYQYISKFYDASMRKMLIDKLECGTLTWFELLGDYVAWAGSIRKQKDGTWIYTLDS